MREVISLMELEKRCADIEKLKEHKNDILVRFGKYRNNDVDWMICNIDVEKEQILLVTEKVVTFFEYGLDNTDIELIMNAL